MDYGWMDGLYFALAGLIGRYFHIRQAKIFSINCVKFFLQSISTVFVQGKQRSWFSGDLLFTYDGILCNWVYMQGISCLHPVDNELKKFSGLKGTTFEVAWLSLSEYGQERE